MIIPIQYPSPNRRHDSECKCTNMLVKFCTALTQNLWECVSIPLKRGDASLRVGQPIANLHVRE